MDFMELIQAFQVYKREKYLDILDAIKKGQQATGKSTPHPSQLS